MKSSSPSVVLTFADIRSMKKKEVYWWLDRVQVLQKEIERPDSSYGKIKVSNVDQFIYIISLYMAENDLIDIIGTLMRRENKGKPVAGNSKLEREEQGRG